MKKTYSIAIGLAAAGISSAAIAANGVNIQQMPRNSKLVDGNKESAIKAEENSESTDFQAEVLTDPTINAHARTTAVIKENGFNGNTAVIVQSGKSNKSSITQTGNGNYASQKQTGKHNDIRLEQNGDDNSSVEEQSGQYSHKLIIQNGSKSEETIIEQADPKQSDY
jgi:hypothetical protein